MSPDYQNDDRQGVDAIAKIDRSVLALIKRHREF